MSLRVVFDLLVAVAVAAVGIDAQSGCTDCNEYCFGDYNFSTKVADMELDRANEKWERTTKVLLDKACRTQYTVRKKKSI